MKKNKGKIIKRTYTKKSIIESMINTTALTLTTSGVILITKQRYLGFIPLAAGFILEFLKYYGRNKGVW